MAKKPEKKKPVTHRVTTQKPNGATSMEVAPAPSPVVDDLGAILLPSPDDAVIVLRQLAELNDKAIRAHKVYLDAKDKAKIAKEKWDELAEEVQTKLRVSTHASDLPLYDPVERESDQAKMETAAQEGTQAHVVADDSAF